MASKSETDFKNQILEVLEKLKSKKTEEQKECDRKQPSSAASIIGSNVSTCTVSVFTYQLCFRQYFVFILIYFDPRFLFSDK